MTFFQGKVKLRKKLNNFLNVLPKTINDNYNHFHFLFKILIFVQFSIFLSIIKVLKIFFKVVCRIIKKYYFESNLVITHKYNEAAQIVIIFSSRRKKYRAR